MTIFNCLPSLPDTQPMPPSTTLRDTPHGSRRPPVADTGLPGRWQQWRQRLVGRLGAGLHAMLGPRKTNGLGILMYHRVVPVACGTMPPTWNVPPARFRAQLVGLLQRGFQPLALREVVFSARQTAAPARGFVVTFDDGYECVYRWAFPILRELQVPATVFLATAALDSGEPFLADDWPEAGEGGDAVAAWRMLRTQQCRAMLESGWIELGTHTHTHADFRGRPDALQADVQQSVRVLHKKFGIVDPPFAFPYGSPRAGFVDPALLDAARAAGVCCALTTHPRPVVRGSDPFGWGRFTAEPWDTPATLAGKLSGWSSLPGQLRSVRRRCPAKQSAAGLPATSSGARHA